MSEYIPNQAACVTYALRATAYTLPRKASRPATQPMPLAHRQLGYIQALVTGRVGHYSLLASRARHQQAARQAGQPVLGAPADGAIMHVRMKGERERDGKKAASRPPTTSWGMYSNSVQRQTL